MKKHLFIIAALVSGLMMTGCSKDDDDLVVEISSGTAQVGDVTIEIPEGALSSGIKVTAEEMTVETVPGQLDGFVGGVQLGPSGTKFDKPVKVTIPVSDVPASSKLLVFYWNEDEQTWESVGVTRVSGGKATFEVTHFSDYALADFRMWQSLDMVSRYLSGNSGANSSLEGVIAACQQAALNDVSDFYDIRPGWCMVRSVRYAVTYVTSDAQKSTGYVLVNNGVKLEEEKFTSTHRVCIPLNPKDEDESVLDASRKTLANLLTENGPFIMIQKVAHLSEKRPDIEVVNQEGELNAKGDKVKLTLQATVSCEEPIPVTISVNTRGSETTQSSKVNAPEGKFPVAKGLVLAKPENTDEIKLQENRLDTDGEGKVTFTVEALSDEVDSQVFFYYKNLKNEKDPDLSVPFTPSEWQIFGDYTYKTFTTPIKINAKCQFFTRFSMGGFKPNEDGIDIQEVNVEVTPGKLDLSSYEYTFKDLYDDSHYEQYVYSNVRSSGTLLLRGKLSRTRIQEGDSVSYLYDLHIDRQGFRGLWFADCKEDWYDELAANPHTYHNGTLFVQGVTNVTFMSNNEEGKYTLSSEGNYLRGDALCSGCGVSAFATDPDEETHATIPFIVALTDETSGTLYFQKVLDLLP